MNLIRIKDKQFEEYISSRELEKLVETIVAEIKQLNLDLTNLVLVGVLEGAIPFMKDLIKKLDYKIEVDYIKVSSYGDEMQSSMQVKLMQDCLKNLAGKDVLIVEDIVDTGRTQEFLMQHFQSKKVKSVKICSLFYKSVNNATGIKPDIFGKDIPDYFIVGYGLDYAQEGRNLHNILKLSED